VSLGELFTGCVFRAVGVCGHAGPRRNEPFGRLRPSTMQSTSSVISSTYCCNSSSQLSSIQSISPLGPAM
jgi:hypothetical protein